MAQPSAEHGRNYSRELRTVNGFRHFSEIAHKYSELRITDFQPVLYIRNQLRYWSQIAAADIGSGDGRYSLELLRLLKDRMFLYCVDNNGDMLGQLMRSAREMEISDLQALQSPAENLPFSDSSLDCLFTFNAIHLFQCSDFLLESSRVLKKGGVLFIYTRLKSQNRNSIWGRYFPLFAEKESRLFELEGLKDQLNRIPDLAFIHVEYFAYHRVSNLDRLLEKARNCHYSTFCLYTPSEFEQSLTEFEQNIHDKLTNADIIQWIDGNVLVVVKKLLSQESRK